MAVMVVTYWLHIN